MKASYVRIVEDVDIKALKSKAHLMHRIHATLFARTSILVSLEQTEHARTGPLTIAVAHEGPIEMVEGL